MYVMNRFSKQCGNRHNLELGAARKLVSKRYGIGNNHLRKRICRVDSFYGRPESTAWVAQATILVAP